VGGPRFGVLLRGQLHAPLGEVAAHGVAEGDGGVPQPGPVQGQGEGPRHDLRPLGEDGRREAGHPRLLHAGGGGHVGHRAALAEPGLDLPDRQRALGPGGLLVGVARGGVGLVSALEPLLHRLGERLIDGEQVAARARATANAQDERVSRCGDADQMKLLHA